MHLCSSCASRRSAVRHPVHGLAGEVRHPDQPERLLHDGAVRILHPPDPVGVGGASQRDDILAREVGDPYLVGGDECDGGGALPGRHLRQRLPAEFHPPRRDRPQSGYGPQQGAFARAVASDQGGQRPRFERGADVGEQRAASVGEADMFETDAHRFRRGCGCG